MKKCSKICKEKEVDCPISDCKFWVNYKGDNNCSLIAIEELGEMGLVEVAKRIGVSHVRIQQIQNSALVKLSIRCNKEELMCILPE